MVFDLRTSFPGGVRLTLPLLACVAAACSGPVPPPSLSPVPVENACAVVPIGGVGRADRTGAAASVTAGASAVADTSVPRPMVVPEISTASGTSDAPIVVGVSGAIDPSHAPVPRTPAEELVFAQLYETLVRIDCEGRVVAGVAESWSEEEDGRSWTFRIRPDVRDWRGDPIDARSVAESLGRPRVPNAPAGPSARDALGIEGLTVLGEHALRVQLGAPAGAAHFARPELRVTTGMGADGWPIGTGAFRPVVRPAGATTSGVRVTGPATVEVRPVSGDVRDVLEGGVDLLVTRDPAVIEYAEASPTFEALPLAWDRSYLLVTAGAVVPAEMPPAASSPLPPRAEPVLAASVLALPESAASALARDAVRVEARAPTATADVRCAMNGGGVSVSTPSTRARRIVYPASDGTARALAERLVALAISAERAEASWLPRLAPELTSGERVAAAGLSDPAFDEAVRAGRDAAFVVPVRRGELAAACELADSVAMRAPWVLAPTNLTSARAPAILPLLEARSTLVARGSIEGVVVDGGGTLRLERVRRASPGGTP